MANALHNNPGLGIEYEVHVPAYFALLLNDNPNIEDFTLRSNDPEFENLDDLLIEIKTKGGGTLYFALQLKHKENLNKKLLPTDFEAKDKNGKLGPYNLEKYCKAFKKLNEDNRKKYHFILYTNNNFDLDFDSSCTSQVKKKICVQPTQDVYCFDTSAGDNNLYKFEVNEDPGDGKNVNIDDFRKFFSQFSLYTGQANAKDFEKSILAKLKYEKYYPPYIDFFRKWHKREFTNNILDKKTFNVHLLDIFLSSFAINYYLSDGQDGNSNFFEKMVKQSDITIIEDSQQDFIKLLEVKVHHNYPKDIIELAKKHKFIDKFTNELKEETKLKLLHYFYEKPLILDFRKSSEDVIYEASKLCKIQENKIKLVILGQNIDNSNFSHLKIFTDLKGVNGENLEEIKRRCSLSLQGRNISFGEIFEEEIREFVTPRKIFQMLKGNFSIGEDKEKVPECYIPRSVSATIFDIESIIKDSSTSAAIVFYYEDKFEELKNLIQKFVDREKYLYEENPDAIIMKEKKRSKKQSHEGNTKETLPEVPTIIILRKENCSRKQLNEIHEELEKKDVHLFKVIDEKRCLLLMSTKNISHKFTKITVGEDNIRAFFNNSINILCAQPGMGKSTLMKYLKNVCDPNFWTVMVDLKSHNHFLKRNHETDDVLNYFLELENCPDKFLFEMKKMFLGKRKIVLFLDGLDEIENECVDFVLNITKQLSEKLFRVWLSSRQNLQQKIEQYFNIFAIEINELNEVQQENYIKNRLNLLYNKNEIDEIVDKISNNTDLVNNRQILETPLQLHIITQNFLDNKSYYSNFSEDYFILTKMMETFFEGKYKHFVNKIGLDYIVRDEIKYTRFLEIVLQEQLRKYEIPALHSVLDDKHFQKLQIENLEPILNKDWDFLGIITKVNMETNKVVFEHLTYAEYFAAKFLVKHFDKARILREEIFGERYQNLFLIFNIMLAEGNPLHLAIIYKNKSRIEKMGQSTLVDDEEGGRTCLQVAACVATRHPLLKSLPYYPSFLSDECLVDDLREQLFKGEDSTMKDIVNLVLPMSGELYLKNDKIFKWNSLDYALATGALYIVEAILLKFEKPPNFYEMLVKYYSDKVVAYYSVICGYHRLLSEILAQKSYCHVTRTFISNYLWEQDNDSILHFLFRSHYTTRTKIVELLTDDNINKIVYKQREQTFLHFAVLYEDTEIVKFLLEKSADVNAKDRNGFSPLFYAIKRNNFEISKLLIENGADVNIKDDNECTPLFFAVEQNNFKISKLLIEKGADINIKDDNECTPLFFAVEQNNFKISKLLIEKGADINIKDDNECTPLFFAVEQNNFEISKLLIEKGADVNIKDKDGRSPLLWAVTQDSLEISKLLIEKEVDVNIKDDYGCMPLFFAVQQNNFEISKLLIEKGANVNIKDKYGWSPLHWSVRICSFEISELLVENGADVNIQDKNGKSPLGLAADLKNLEIAKLLVEKVPRC